MTFENHLWLTLTPIIVLLLLGMITFGMRRRDALLSKFAAARLLDNLTEKASHKRTLLKAALILFAFASIGIALARPQYGVDFIERKARGLDIVFVLDSSKSMLATDMRPNRLDRAKLAILDLVKRLESDRIGLVTFAGNAFLQTPPTLDYAAFRENLESIDSNIITRGGSNIGKAITEAAKAFPSETNFKIIILLTDGEDLDGHVIETVTEAAKDGIKVYTIGIGTPEGEYLKIRTAQGAEEFIRDANGQPVRSQLDESTLQKIAQLTGGSYSRLSNQSLDALYSSVIATLPREERESEMQESRIERFQWVLSAAAIFLVLEIFIRRRAKSTIHAALLLTLFITAAPQHSEAQEPPTSTTSTAELPLPITEEAPNSEEGTDEVPNSTDPRELYNQACRLLKQGDYPTAQQRFQSTIEATSDLELQRDALYNMGHAVNQQGEAAFQAEDFETAVEKWKAAEALFDSAHEIDAQDITATQDSRQIGARRQALEDFLEQEKEKQEQSEDSDQPDQSEETEDEEKSEGEKDKPSDEKGEGEESEGEDSEQSENESDEQDSQSENEDDQGEEGDEGESDASETAEGDEPESTADPADDIPEQPPEPGEEEGDESGEEAGDESPQAGEASEGEPGEGEPIEIQGMSLIEAQDLLDSLRDDERLLPFVDPSQSDHKRDTRDW